ncbi:peptidase inhibitor family I36 protein [Lentzea sp. NEAU-D7]|uniref:peptidase inhibitor family I36 protein n=1 Tax=Lentzea sp. NEAU-D7 TaxID=2994667 RepID=UPI00224A6B25|nr:hypothetical protein [Lentzea sp. NEAU-D7]MCX2952771.1 hypothetical protein [Lentzea sp. NEAU-D7]
MFARKAAALLATAAAVVVSVAVAPSASAHVPNRCSGWRVGVFDLNNYAGQHACFNTGAGDLRQFSLNNRISSAWSHDTVPWCLYDDFSFRSPFSQMAAGGHYPVFDAFATNRTSSIRRGACPAGFGVLPEPGVSVS